MIKITDEISISEDEIVFTASRSSGPGGQNVNKVNTRVTVILDVKKCVHFSDDRKRQILERLATRANKNGVVRVVSHRYRTQKANRKAATERLVSLLKNALEKKPRRKRTRIPFSVKQQRLEMKKRRSALKQERKKKIEV